MIAKFGQARSRSALLAVPLPVVEQHGRVVVERVVLQGNRRAQQAGPPVYEAYAASGGADGRGRAARKSEVRRIRYEVDDLADAVAHVRRPEQRQLNARARAHAPHAEGLPEIGGVTGP